MSALLDEWIGKTVEQELGEAIRWRQDTANSSLNVGNVGDLAIEDDGSNLRLRSSKRRIVQIIKFETFDEPHKATVSDGISRIKVKISSDASQRYREKNKRSLTHGTPGGLIQLLDFDIVATHLGPRPERVTIDVNDFKSLGSNGSGNFGGATPYSVESRLEIKQLLQKLEILRNRNSQGGHLSPNPSIRSQFSTASSVEESDSVSQAVFATQPRFAAMPAARSSNARVAGEQSGLGFPAGTDDRDTTAHSNGALSKNIAPNNAPADSEHIHSGKRTVNGKKHISHASAALLGLVRQAAHPIAKDNPVLQVTNWNPATIPIPGDKVTIAGGEGGTGDAEPPPVPFTAPSQDFPLKGAAASLPDPTAEYNSAPTPINGNQSQYPSRNRISNRDVRIPRDQALLLESEDSWSPALPGHRGPVANVPISILNSLNREADLGVLRAENPLKRKRGTTAMTEAQAVPIGSSNESESEIPLSSGQWPSSPDRNQLPPDSSMGSTIAPEVKEKTGPVAPSTPGIFTRKLVNISPKPSVIPRLPLGTANGQTSWRSSKEPSPSVISNSAGEDKNLFKCPTVNCGNSYKSALALNHHTERYHKARESREEFKCSEENCNKSYTTSGGLNYHVKHHHNSKKPPLDMPKTSNQVLLEPSADKEMSASLHLPSQSSESDLEMKVPDALAKDRNMNAGSVPMQTLPSTAPQSELPFTQVKRTPYPNGQISSAQLASPLRPGSLDTPTGSLPYSNSHVNLSVSEHPASLSTEAQAPTIDKQFSNPQNPEMAKPKVSTYESNNSTERDTHKLDSHHETPVALERRVPRADSADQLSRNPSINGFNTSYRRAETEQLIDSFHMGDKVKRKPEDAFLLSPNVSKRRKRLEFPATFDLPEEVEDRQDPSAGARRIRKEFLASRKGSESSTPIQSPTRVPPSGVNKTFAPTEISSAETQITQTEINFRTKIDTEDANGRPTAIPNGFLPADVVKSPTPAIDLDNIASAADDPHSTSSTTKHIDQTVESVELDVDFDDSTNQKENHPSETDDDETKPGAQDQQPDIDETEQASERIVEDHLLQNTKVTVPNAKSAPATIFDVFKETYPSYTGDIKHFVTMCTKISTLLEAGRLEYPASWDDFIIRQRTEYSSYVIGCTEGGEDPMAYEDYYSKIIMGTKYNGLVLTRHNLNEALSLAPRGNEVIRTAHEIKEKDNTNRKSRAYPQIHPLSPSTSSVVSNGLRPASIIDLTGGDQSIQKDSSPTDKQTPSRRSIPWKDHGSPLGSDASQNSPGTSQHARFKEFMNTSKVSRSPAHKPTARNRHDRPVSRGAMIISAWGMSANEVIKGKYVDSITQKQVNLMKDIAHDVDVVEGRHLIEKQINSRTRHISGIATPKLTDEDLEAVKEAVSRKPALAEVQTQRSRVGNDSSMTTSDPMSTSQANASEGLRDPSSGSDQWWRDDSTPFNVFARAYTSIKPGNGNAFAQTDSVHTESRHRGDGDRSGRQRRTRRIDLMQWEL